MSITLSPFWCSNNYSSSGEAHFASKETSKYKLKSPEKSYVYQLQVLHYSVEIIAHQEYSPAPIKYKNCINLSKYIQTHQFLYQILNSNHFCLLNVLSHLPFYHRKITFTFLSPQKAIKTPQEFGLPCEY